MVISKIDWMQIEVSLAGMVPQMEKLRSVR